MGRYPKTKILLIHREICFSATIFRVYFERGETRWFYREALARSAKRSSNAARIHAAVTAYILKEGL